MRPWLVRIPVPLFGLGALFHAATLLVPGLGQPAPPWRHALFLGINATFTVLFAQRPRWLWLAYAPLALQQIGSHGGDLWRSSAPWHELQDLLALASIPLFAWLAATAWSEARPPRTQP